MTRALLVALAVLAASAPPAIASELTGIWMRDDGSAKLRFSACGGGTMCGFLAWKKESGGAAKIGQRLFSDMKPSGEDSWAGAAFNPEDGKRYTAKLTALRRSSGYGRLRARRAHLQVVRLDPDPSWGGAGGVCRRGRWR